MSGMRTKMAVVFGASMMATAFSTGAASSITRAADSVLSPQAQVAAKTQGEWSVIWWQWASSFSYQDSPIADVVGDRCGSGQEGPVWFLAGVYGSAPVKRRCTVPAGKHLFFPIINYMVSSNPSGAMSCEAVTSNAKDLTDSSTDLTLIVDGEEIRNLDGFRQVSPGCFNLGERIHRDISPTAANGYFVMLKPLAPGRHVVKWGGALDSLRQAVVYEITVSEHEEDI
jgi:hypothetical protein